MNIQEIIETVTKEEIEKAQALASSHFENGNEGTRMNMIAFD